MKKLKKLMYIILSIVLLIAIGGYIFLQQNVFGAKPTGERLTLIKRSKNYKDGKFQNLSLTPQFTEGYTFSRVMFNFLFRKNENGAPADSIPYIATDLKQLDTSGNFLVWFGHSSYLMRIDGKTFLVDPVLSGYASPLKGMNKPFKGADYFKAEHLPPVDYLLITHDHYDHLDYETMKSLKGRVGKIICPLGVGAHLEKWGFDPAQFVEKDWGEMVQLDDQFMLHFTPARHFSGRSFWRNNTLWTSYVLQTPTKKIYIGGDSGYDQHFAEIGNKFGGFDLAILENGQYNEAWRYIHAMPEEVLQAGRDLKAKRLFPVHSGKFALAGHPWFEPLSRITELNEQSGQSLVTPMIGEVVDLDNEGQVFQNWWGNVK